MSNLVLNAFASISNELISIVSGLILPRLFLVAYGSNVNGLISSITQFFSFISLCELGIGPVIKASLYGPLAAKDDYKISCIVKSSRRFFHKVALILLFYTVVLSFLYPVIVLDEFNFFFTASLILIISIGYFMQYFFGLTNQLLLAANQQSYIQSFSSSIVIILNLLICAFCIIMGWSIQAAKLCSVLAFTLRPIILFFYVKKHYNLSDSVEYSSEPIKQKWNGFSQHLATIIQDNTDVVILTLFSSLHNVSIYGIYYLIINGVKMVINSLLSGVSSYLGLLIALGDKKRLDSRFSFFEWLIHTISTILFSMASLLIVPFVACYTEGIEDANYIVPVFGYFISFCGWLRSIQIIYNLTIQNAGHFKQTQKWIIWEPVINIIISVAFVMQYGLIGVTIGTMISLLYRLFFLILYLKKHILNREIKIFIKHVVVDIAVAFSLIIFASNLVGPINSLSNWILCATILGILAIAVSFFINLIVYPCHIRFVLGQMLSIVKRKNKRI